MNVIQAYSIRHVVIVCDLPAVVVFRLLYIVGKYGYLDAAGHLFCYSGLRFLYSTGLEMIKTTKLKMLKSI